MKRRGKVKDDVIKGHPLSSSYQLTYILTKLVLNLHKIAPLPHASQISFHFNQPLLVMRSGIELFSPTLKVYNQEHFLVLRLNGGTIHGSNTEQVLFLRLHAKTIQESNPKFLPCFKASCGNDPRVQYGTPHCFLSSKKGRSADLQ